MPSTPKDFRSDTVTRPTPAMRAAMAAAVVGDDVWGEDPTVIELQDRVAALLGKEAALFVPSGTMSNLIALRLHCRPGEAVICEAQSHVYFYEQGGYAQVNGAIARPLPGATACSSASSWRPCRNKTIRTFPVPACSGWRTHTIVAAASSSLTKTWKRSAGWARQKGLRMHLDGARLWNAAVASGIALARWTQHFDTASVCFSKGLGAPVGSAIAGPRDLIREALRHRKVFGGGMRQAGVLAAAALYALDHHVERLAEDHANARKLAAGLRQISGLRLDPETIDSNLVFFHLQPGGLTAAELVERLRGRDILMGETAPYSIRAATHLDVTGGRRPAGRRGHCRRDSAINCFHSPLLQRYLPCGFCTC